MQNWEKCIFCLKYSWKIGFFKEKLDSLKDFREHAIPDKNLSFRWRIKRSYPQQNFYKMQHSLKMMD